MHSAVIDITMFTLDFLYVVFFFFFSSPAAKL